MSDSSLLFLLKISRQIKLTMYFRSKTTISPIYQAIHALSETSASQSGLCDSYFELLLAHFIKLMDVYQATEEL
jgi:hypothetical protein